MGTRGLCGFRLDGKDYLAYNHFDSYPSGLGKDVLNFLVGTDLTALPGKVRALRLVLEGDIPTPADVAHCASTTNLGVSNQSPQDWYCLLRGAQGNLQAYLDLGLMPDNSTNVADSLFMEWSYIVNLDEQTLEVYRGFNKVGSAAGGRYAGIGPDGDYWGIALLMTIPFDKLESVPVEKWVERMYRTDNDSEAA